MMDSWFAGLLGEKGLPHDRLAAEGRVALLVADGPKLVGIISERDYARKVILQGRASPTTRVREIMTANSDSHDARTKIIFQNI